MPEWKETKKIKVVALYEQTPKQVEPDPNPKNSLNINLNSTLTSIQYGCDIKAT